MGQDSLGNQFCAGCDIPDSQLLFMLFEKGDYSMYDGGRQARPKLGKELGQEHLP
jgi:hypothetical protein